ncbi:MAG: polysaccharide pyruvyl transferase CsaB [Synergistaceae bacterium]|jgi:polysaccharide pyruvyl transferase CsaB|nr:polysaccharide pyruvyl transferase CsaB [Synergistaceae bacterium]
MKTPRRYRVALAGYYGFGNLGDELLLEASIAALLRCGVARERIVALSNNPDDSRRKFGVDAVDRWKIPQVYRALGRSETFLLGGGGLFQDATSLRSCVYYWGLVRGAAFQGAVPWALGQSVGPLRSRFARWLTRDALKRCRVVQVRDRATLSLCETLGLNANVELGHDLAFSLSGVFFENNPGNQVSKLLVNLRPCADGLPERFAKAVSAYASAFTGDVLGVALSEEDECLMRRLTDEKLLFLPRIERVATFLDAVRVFHGAKAAVGMRLHFAILATLTSTPLVVAPYDPKVEAFASDGNIPMWRGGPLPPPQLPAAVFSPEALRKEIDVLCRNILESERL